MPAPIIHQDLSGLAQGITGAGSALGQALQFRGQQQKQQQMGTTLQNIMDDLGPEASAMDIYSKAIQQGIDPGMASQAITLQTAEQKSAIAQLKETQKEAQKKEKLRSTYELLRPQLAQRGIDLPEEPPGDISISALTTLLSTTRPQFEPTEQKLEAERVSKLADDIEKGYKGARTEDMRLDRQERLADKGNLSTPMMVKALDYMGLPIGVLQNPDTEEYAKIEADYVRDVSDIFTGQIRVYEIEAYMKTIPGLLNSDKGKKVVIRNRRLLNEGKKVKYEAYKEILKENKGKKPRNLGLLIDERTKEKMYDIAQRFKDGIEGAEKFQPMFKMYNAKGIEHDIPSSKIPDAVESGFKFR